MTEKTKTAWDEIGRIQQTLKAPKNQFNSHGKYHYRSCEDILEALKPMLDGAKITFKEELVEKKNRLFMYVTAVFTLGDEVVEIGSHAELEESRKGMSAAQLTGATVSYAKKYALNSMFAIDDSRDPDTFEGKTQAGKSGGAKPQQQSKEMTERQKQQLQFKKLKDKLGREQCAIIEAAWKKTGSDDPKKLLAMMANAVRLADEEVKGKIPDHLLYDDEIAEGREPGADG